MSKFDSVKYGNSFLNQVIVRLDFLQFAVSENVFCNDVEKNILRYFPRKGIDQLIRFNAINVVFDPNNPTFQNTRGEFQDGIQREYYSINQKNKTILSNKFLIIEINEYSDFEELQQWLQSIAIPFFKKNRVTVVRTGIRYINIISPNRIRIRKNMFSPEIAATLGVNEFAGDDSIQLTRSMHVTEYQLGELHLNFRYGLFNPQYPNQLNDNSFALDYDCFTEEPIETVDGILQCVEKGHDTIQMLFETSISDAFRRVMNNE